ncbi:MAG: aminotransferase class V-fold PLP-dependent enzyme [Anaeromusa sp.]|uniref:aminotransferase class V-fold PLP-dependent enzyme n=1 Tax=Anaeromusa sp. TaxID=1872520 RepID=UPI002B20DD56|nr:aminotransferase class V-fold PLP-dependent enzyme [Anaeromusa sp.]MEA4835908.1 aminotransferase class V-fold PLP-dependent enzyme [Anaeromusa sp.]NCB76624.1 aminotransferase class V-fold PLP-dependent enzyme [Negativicutes bacterium]
MIYLDNAATTWPKPKEVAEAVAACIEAVPGTPGRGSHQGARQAARIAFEAREEIAALFDVDDATRIAFCGNATQALNTALFGLLQPGDVVVTSSWEHNAVVRPLHVLEQKGVVIRKIPPTQEGPLDLTALEEALPGAKALVLTHASNVTGAILPLQEAAALAARHGCLVIVDAAQTAGVEEIKASWGLHVIAFAGHKGLLGPQGTGGLYVAPQVSVKPLIFGGTGSRSEEREQPSFYPDCLESGTLNTPGLAGLLAGVRFVRTTGRERIRYRESELAEKLRTALRKMQGISMKGEKQGQLQTAVLSFTVEGIDSNVAALWLEEKAGIICRAGLHCAPWAHEALGTLETGTIRLSPGYFNTDAEIEAAIKALHQLTQAF